MSIRALALLIASAVLSGTAGAETDRLGELARLTKAFCEAGLDGDAETIAAEYGRITALDRRGRPDGPSLTSIEIAGRSGDRAQIHVTAFSGAVRRVRGEIHGEVDAGGAVKPLVLIDRDAACNLLHGRALDYDGGPTAVRLVHYDAALEPAGPAEELNPPVPAGRDPGGVAVAHVDSGVNYLLPEIAARLARDAGGDLVGRDFWDGDDRPFDLDTGRSPFFPLRHGTAVASVLLREAPGARLMPFRYPRPDMALMGDLVDAAAAGGARILMMPLGSRNSADWPAFAAAARRHADILFIVSAGNDGRDIDADPLYPAALPLDNLVVVTSADPFGRLAEGSNWGAETVDLMTPGEKIPVIDHRGASVSASGSSYAVPRIAALAARLLEAHPEWRAAELVEAIRARCGRSFERGPRKVKWGFLPNPADDG